MYTRFVILNIKIIFNDKLNPKVRKKLSHQLSNQFSASERTASNSRFFYTSNRRLLNRKVLIIKCVVFLWGTYMISVIKYNFWLKFSRLVKKERFPYQRMNRNKGNKILRDKVQT